jgi:hypothetical protein
VAHGRLRKIQPLCRPSNVTFRQKHLKYEQQVEVRAAEINFIHGVKEYYELD